MMTYDEAKKLFIPKEFPFGFRYYNEKFIEVEIKTNRFEKPDIARNDKFELYKKMFKNKEYVSPIWGSIGRKLKNGKIQRFQNYIFQIKDGNHRLGAAIDLGIKKIKVILPESHWREYENN